MNCQICKRASDSAICSSCLAAVAKVVAKKSAPIPPKPPDYRIYWHIRDGVFECIVDMRDAPTEDEALLAAYSPLQAWYYAKEVDAFNDCKIERMTHNQYCDWLRKASQKEVGTGS